MQLVPHAEFSLPSSAATGAAAGPSITCHQLNFRQRLLFVGTSAGALVAFRRKTDSQGVEQIDSKPTVLEGHTGTIRCLLLVQAEGLGQDGYLLFSGGADRTVRVWDPSAGKAKACVQVLRGHGGTVTSLAYCEGVLVTASTDCTIRVWRQDEGRELLLYPWLSPQHTLTDLGQCWVSDLALMVGEAGALYAGDEEGNISAYRVERASGGGGGIELAKWRRQPKAHALGIERLLLVSDESLLITSAYDHCVKVRGGGGGAAAAAAVAVARALSWPSTRALHHAPPRAPPRSAALRRAPPRSAAPHHAPPLTVLCHALRRRRSGTLSRAPWWCASRTPTSAASRPWRGTASTLSC